MEGEKAKEKRGREGGGEKKKEGGGNVAFEQVEQMRSRLCLCSWEPM